MPYLFALYVIAASLAGSDWRQFRGPNASGVLESKGLPVVFGGDTNLVWRTPIPPGHSSPAISHDRIFLTAVEGEKLLTLALDRASGRILWRREAPRPRKQVIDRPANGPVSASPVTDGTNTYVFFQDFGLLSYGPDGNERWRMPLGPFNNPFGHGASPVLAGNLLVMVCDQDTNAFVVAIDKDSGKVAWKTDRPHAQRGYATPIPYKAVDGSPQIIVTGSYRMSGYDAATGKEVWWIRKLPWQVKPTPVVADHVVYFVTYSAESEPGQQEELPPFSEALEKLDRNQDGKLSKEEITDPRVKARFDEYLDLDHSGFLEARDWSQLRERRQGESGLRAYKLGGKGDLTETGFLWKQSKSLPNVPSPLVYRGVLYTLKEGGIFTSYDPRTGEILKQARLQGALGNYFASPVAADGKVYLASEDAKVTVLEAGPQWRILQINEMDGACSATPAIVEGHLYIRTRSSMSRFAQRAQ